MGSSSCGFLLICVAHSLIALTCGGLMMFYSNEVIEVGTKLKGSTGHDQLLIQTSDSFCGLLLFGIGLLLFMVALIKDRDFQIFFAKGCLLLHFLMAIWRLYFQSKLQHLAPDLPRLLLADVALALSWVFFLLYSWRDQYI